jgi:hypothetical protein
MLWMKAWFETRWRLAYVFGLPVSAIALLSLPLTGPPKDPNAALGSLGFMCLFGCIYLAGAGIQTQSMTGKGLHSSTVFTLTLPVSRLRLLAVRAGLGFLQAALLVAIVLCSEWLLFPFVRFSSTPSDLLKMIAECIALAALLYSLSVLFATFLDAVWQIYGTMIAFGALWFVASRLHLPRSVDIFRLMTGDSPLVAHTLFWGRIAVSCTLALISFLAAARIVQTREY